MATTTANSHEASSMTLAASGAWKAASRKPSQAKRRWRSDRNPAERIRPVCRDRRGSPSPVRPILRCPIVPTELRRCGSTFRAIVALSLVSALLGCAPRLAARPAADRPDHVAAGPLLDRTGASLTVADAASRVQVTMATLPGLLYRVSTPGDSGLEPHVTSENGNVRVRLAPTGGDGPDEVRIVLN